MNNLMLAEDSSVKELTLFNHQNKDNKTPQSAKDFIFRKVSPQLACELNSIWHSILPQIHWSNVVRNTHYVCFVALYDGRFYAVAIWSSPVAQNRFANGKEMLELRRLAISKNCPKNTASRMISQNIKTIKRDMPEIKRLISYQDTEVHLGTIYKASGWEKATKTAYIPWDNEKRKRSESQIKSEKIRWERWL